MATILEEFGKQSGDRPRIVLYHDVVRDRVDLVITGSRPDPEGGRSEKFYVAAPLQWTRAAPESANPVLLSLEREAAQELFESLHEQGFRLRKDQEERGALGAMKNHLEDMRELVFKYHTEKKS